MHAEVSLRLFNQIIVYCYEFDQWMAALTAEQCSVIRKVHVHKNDTKFPGFWHAVSKLGGLRKLFVRTNLRYETVVVKEDSNGESDLWTVFKEKLNSTVGHEVELELEESLGYLVR